MIFNVPGHVNMIRIGLYVRPVSGFIVKTQTRRLNRGIYKVGKDYAVQRKRGVKAEPDIRIVMDGIWEEKAGLGHLFPRDIKISFHDAYAEGGYTEFEYEQEFRKAYPKWDGQKRWAFRFHAIEVQDKMNAIAWRHCNKCEKIIKLLYYPFNQSISEELDILEEEHQLHLCLLCSKAFPTCNAKKVVFGSCVGNDNVIECNRFVAKKKK